MTYQNPIATADACRARDDQLGALAALRPRVVYRARERQSLARLADVWLVIPEDASASAWFDKAQALAQFLAVVAGHEPRDLPMPGSWDDARIEEVATRARAWFASARPCSGGRV